MTTNTTHEYTISANGIKVLTKQIGWIKEICHRNITFCAQASYGNDPWLDQESQKTITDVYVELLNGFEQMLEEMEELKRNDVPQNTHSADASEQLH